MIGKEVIEGEVGREFPNVTDSCGCVFCDLNLEPAMVAGRMMHWVRQTPDYEWKFEPCTRE